MQIFELNNGINIPALGLGTFQMSPDQAQKAVVAALESGYRLLDTANAYLNEKAVGRGIKESSVARQDIFLSSKLWPTVYQDKTAVDKTLQRLGTDYLDLLFLHQPAGDFMAGYRQLEQAYRDGKIKAIGISNFHGEKLTQLLEQAEIKPQVIQVEAHPYYPQKDVRETLIPYGTRVMAWYPLGHGDKSLLNEPIFTKLAQKYGKSNAQIILRWHVQMGFIVIPGSTNPAHIKDNADIFDFELTADEMAEIAKIDQNKRYYIPNDAREEQYARMQMDFEAQK
ncbi:aldo/keto reductase [Ligilactobacillus apodemi]|uniref:Oxidoreductase n=1 Tax=Ligilactobacillus apodemi DSM 16634 = JCM 16172 TaxID=1423724 RepID=A0A0R1TQ18_9LACO|nr:aldo/keto reductase [Ligilactobacillus apodemi]KRL83392.1 oxidoreductase [Ligilactobacillus apodemi DSM 16634 = JCM 16172]